MGESQQKLTKVNELTATQRAFVIARAQGKTVAQAAEVAGINRSTPAAKWDMDLINEAIAELQMSWVSSPIEALAPLLPVALEQLGELIKGREFEAIQELFNRLWGKPVQRSELSGPGGEPIRVQQTSELTDDQLLAIASRGGDGTA
jgi:hypothetical protein